MDHGLYSTDLRRGIQPENHGIPSIFLTHPHRNSLRPLEGLKGHFLAVRVTLWSSDKRTHSWCLRILAPSSPWNAWISCFSREIRKEIRPVGKFTWFAGISTASYGRRFGRVPCRHGRSEIFECRAKAIAPGIWSTFLNPKMKGFYAKIIEIRPNHCKHDIITTLLADRILYLLACCFL